MRNRRSRMFRNRSNGRNFRHRSNDDNNMRLMPGSFSNARPKINFKSHQSAEKLLEKYKILAKEALSSGDITLSENYLQHIDHFERIISHKNLNQNQNENSSQVANIIKEQNNNLSNNGKINKDHTTKNKE